MKQNFKKHNKKSMIIIQLTIYNKVIKQYLSN